MRCLIDFLAITALAFGAWPLRKVSEKKSSPS
jgi:hypothetical protein